MIMVENWKETLVNVTDSIEHALESLNRSCLQIVLVREPDGFFVGTVTDGDIRRGMLRGLNASSPLESIVNQHALIVPPEMTKESVLHLMRVNYIKQLPIVDENRKVVGLHIFDEVKTDNIRENLFVVMAGGKGTRMRPYTENCPKPMLPIGDKPMLEHILTRAINEGFRNFVFCIHYLGKMIRDYFGNGEKWKVNIRYIEEESPLGTAGALHLIDWPLQQPLIVTNGDVLTEVQYGDIIQYLEMNNAQAAMAVRSYILQHPFGVVNTKGIEIINFEEKPGYKTLVNAGIYCLRPDVLKLIPNNTYMDMPDLFMKVRESGENSIVYPMHETWMDVGKPADLEVAKQNS